jgi:hypothetical protein
MIPAEGFGDQSAHGRVPAPCAGRGFRPQLTLNRLNRHDLLALVGVVTVGLLIYGWVAAFAVSLTTYTDSVEYLYMADFYRAVLYGAGSDAASVYYGVTRFPPLYPLLLGALGAGSDELVLAHAVSGSTVVLAAAAVWAWVWRERASAFDATWVALALLLLPQYFLLNLSPVSEPLGLAILAAVLALLAGAPRHGAIVAAALLVGIAPLARTALLPLCAAFAIWILAKRPLPLRQSVLPIVAACLPFLGWTLYRQITGAWHYTNYLTSAHYQAAAMAWPDALWMQPWRAFDAFVSLWSVPAGPLLATLGALLLALAVAGFFMRLRRGALDAGFLALYVPMVLLWPFPEELPRLLVLVFPLILVAALSATDALARWFRLRREGLPSLLLAMMLGVAALPAAVQFSGRAALAVEPELLGEKREPRFFLAASNDEALRLAEAFARARLLLVEAGAAVNDSTCIYGMPPQFVSFYSGRDVAAYPFAVSPDLQAAREVLLACDYFFVGPWESARHRSPPLYPVEALSGWTEPVLASAVTVDGRTRLVAALLRRRGAEPD